MLTQWSSLPKGWCDDTHCGADSPFMEHSLSCQALKERCSVHCLCVTGSSSRPEKATGLNLGAPVTSMGACGSPETRPLSLSRITGALQNTHSFHAAALCLELYCWVVMHRNSRTCQFNQQSTAKALFNFGYILKHIYWVLKSLQFKWQSLFAPQRMFKTTKDHLKLAQFFWRCLNSCRTGNHGETEDQQKILKKELYFHANHPLPKHHGGTRHLLCKVFHTTLTELNIRPHIVIEHQKPKC